MFMELQIHGDKEYIETVIDADAKIFIKVTDKFIRRIQDIEGCVAYLEENRCTCKS